MSDLEREADFIVNMILRDRKALKEWKPDEGYYKACANTRKHMEEARKLMELVRQKLKALGQA
jgi:GH25 family lysozyme M1 (1,4-beta-N-acetylmuramidase)